MAVPVEQSPLFEVDGPHPVPVVAEKGGKRVDIDRVGEWFGKLQYSSEVGCYIFAIRTSKGAIVPWYVGRTTTSFPSECFTADKENKYNKILNRVGHGTAVMFFVFMNRARGKINARAITRLENFLIQEAAFKNGNIFNRIGTKQYQLRIKGVLHGGAGKPAAPAAEFSKMMWRD